MRGDLFDWLGDAVLRFDGTGYLSYYNESARDLLGDNVCIGDHWSKLISRLAPGAAKRIAGAVPRMVAKNGFWRSEVKVPQRGGDGEIFTVLLAADSRAAAKDQNASTEGTGYLLIFRSLSETRRREAAEREVSARDEFVARLGHELRTPLNAVLGFAQLLELEELRHEQRESVERILTAGRHMQALLDEVLDLARVRTGGVDLDVGPVRVLDVVRGVVDLIQPLADKRRIRRYIEPADEAVAVLDRRRLWQVLLNLIGNAVKYGREGGTVRVGVSAPAPDLLRIEVEDDGPGIEPAQLDRLFRPFERLGAERTGVEGTGLGLALSAALTRAMGGSLSAESRLGSGTTFVLNLEAASPSVMAELAHDESAKASAVVLHVSADSDARALVAQALRSQLAVDTVSVDRAAPALETVRQQQPAVIVVDAELPDAVGTELLHRLSSDPLSALVPKIVLAGEADPRVHLRLRAAGAHRVLALPLDVRAFVEAVSAVLRQRGAAGIET